MNDALGISWSVCATVNEPDQVIMRFVEHYRAAGAAQIVLFFDGPAKEIIEQLRAVEEVTCIPHDHALPIPTVSSHELKQVANYRYFIDHICRTGWAGNIDADEHLVACGSGISVGGYLASLPPNISAVRILPAEAVFGPGDDPETLFGATYYRRADNQGDISSLKLAYGHAYPLLLAGLAGHRAGKTFINTGHKFKRIRLHLVEVKQPGPKQQVRVENNHLQLLHYDAISFPMWQRKWRRRVTGEVNMHGIRSFRAKQRAAFVACEGDAAKERSLFESLYCLNKTQIEALEKLSLAGRIEEIGKQAPNLETATIKKIKKALRHGKAMDLLDRSKKRLAEGRNDKALELAKKALSKNSIENVSYNLALEIQQHVGWIHLRSGDVEKARESVRDIGLRTSFDWRKQVTPAPHTGERRMVFICGLHRSGTTMLQAWLNAHYKCAFLSGHVPENEGQFFQDVYPDERPFGGPGSFAFSERMRPNAIIDEKLAREAQARLRDCWEPWIVGEEPVLLEKSPPNITKIDYLRSIFPDSKFIIWSRDPRAVSLATRKWTKNSIEGLLLHWHTAYAAAIEQLAADCAVARYEDFCLDPDAATSKLANFCGLDRRETPLPIGKRFRHIENQNRKYLKAFERVDLGLRYASWRTFGYEL